jgi:hypothetical protein
MYWILLTESHSVVSPRITESKYQVNSVNGESVVLPCVAQGWPLPTYKWFRKDGVERIPLSMNDRITILDGILLIRDVDLHDTGLYQCIVNNTIGEEKVETELIVRCEPLCQVLFSNVNNSYAPMTSNDKWQQRLVFLWLLFDFVHWFLSLLFSANLFFLFSWLVFFLIHFFIISCML